MNLHKLLLTQNPCYKAGRTITPKGVMVHSTGSNNPNLRRYVGPDDGSLGANTNGNHWNRADANVCVHAFIGKLADGRITTYQTLPWHWRGWHCGSGSKGSANDTHISFEICEDGLTDPTYFAKVYQEAVELTARLCNLYRLDPLKDGVVICHQEGYKRGVASNHADVMHWFPKFGKSMDTFRADVARSMKGEDEMTQEQFNAMFKTAMESYKAELAGKGPDAWAEPIIKEAMARNITDGTRPQSLATRQEVVAMVNAATK